MSKRAGRAIAAALGVAAALQCAVGAAPSRRAAPRKPAAPAAPAPVRLSILPARLTLVGPAARRRFVVMGTLASGRTLDLTGRVQLRLGSTAVAALSGNRLSPRGDGSTALVARFGKLTARAAVTVRDATKPVSYSFRNDVVPVLSRLGCSSGTCHGANSGKGGFKLSLRGYAPELDFLWITRQFAGRRISREAPEESLLLRKPLMKTPHGGGKVLEEGSREYYTLLGWLLQGAPGGDESEPKVASLRVLPGDRVYSKGEKQRLVVQATYTDGSVRDVTDRALFRSNDTGVAEVDPETGLVTAQSSGATAVQAKYDDQLAVVQVTVPFPYRVPAQAYARRFNYVDDAVYARLRQLHLEPGALCTDEEFLRRVYVDAIGTLPTADEAREFLDSKDPDKRNRLIDQVLQRPEYASLWALRLCDLSMIRKEHLGRKNTIAVHQWFTEQFLRNRPWDQLVADLVTATGSVDENPATLWWASRQQTRPNSRGWVRHYELTGEIVAQVFLGQRIQCAKCHNHPTERYTQDDYYRFAAIFAQVNGDGRADPIPERFVATDKGEVRHPRTGQVMPAASLDGVVYRVAEGEDRRRKFAEWLTGAGKEMFARNAVNRVWARLFGSGIVEPVDDLRSTNPPRNAELLDALARDLIAHKWDLKYLMGTIMRSRTYQATSRATPNNRIDTQFFSHYPVRRLQGEELMDAIAQVTGVPDRYATYPLGTRAIELSDTELPSQALDTFGRPTRVNPCECDRSMAPSLSQALELFNGDGLQAKLKNGDGIVARLLKRGKPDAEIVEELFLRAFSRRPTAAERKRVAELLIGQTREEAMQDLLWALINSKEFMFHH